MYIEPFWLGVGATVLTEVIAFIGWIIYIAIRNERR